MGTKNAGKRFLTVKRNPGELSAVIIQKTRRQADPPPGSDVGQCGIAYMIAKRVNHLQAQKAAATTWKERRARINTISPGVIVTPLAYDEFAAAGEGYQNMIDTSAAERTGTSDEIAEAGAFLLGEHAGFITGTDLLIDGGVIASIRTGQYKLH